MTATLKHLTSDILYKSPPSTPSEEYAYISKKSVPTSHGLEGSGLCVGPDLSLSLSSLRFRFLSNCSRLLSILPRTETV